jgi:hypothetical protein
LLPPVRKSDIPKTPRNLDLDKALGTLRWSPLAEPASYKKGGDVLKTGWAKIHKGERIVPARRRRKKKQKR